MTEHHSVSEAPGARQRISKRPSTARPQSIPFNQRETCSVRMASEVTGIGRSKLYQMFDDGRIKSVKVDKRRLVVVSSLLDLLRAE
jgi:excisionase family DNA binding protein